MGALSVMGVYTLASTIHSHVPIQAFNKQQIQEQKMKSAPNVG